MKISSLSESLNFIIIVTIYSLQYFSVISVNVDDLRPKSVIYNYKLINIDNKQKIIILKNTKTIKMYMKMR